MSRFITSLFVLSLLFTVAVNAEALTVYSEDFSSDPGYTSTNPSYAYWDSTNQNYYTNVKDNGVSYYGYSPSYNTVTSGTSFHLTYDMNPVSTGWGTYPAFNLSNGPSADLNDHELKIASVWWDGGYNQFSLHAGDQGSHTSTFNTDTWYTQDVDYDGPSKTLNWTVTEKDTGSVFYSDTLNDVTVGDFNQISLGMKGIEPWYGYNNPATTLFDNIQLETEPIENAFDHSSYRTEQFAGFEWYITPDNLDGSVKDAGDNNWSSSSNNVEIIDGNLHLRITQDNDGVWRSSALELLDGPGVDEREGKLGYGKYVFSTETDFTLLDPNAVFGFFTYDRANDDYKNEIDIELTRWGHANGEPLNYTIHTPAEPDPNETSHVSSIALAAAGGTTHSFEWTPDAISFQSNYGVGMSSVAPFAEWEYPRNMSDFPVPEPGPESFLLNFWMNGAQSPSGEQEIVISDFYFVPYSDLANGDFTHGLGNWESGGEGVASVISNNGNNIGQLEAGSPVWLCQSFSALDGLMHLDFDYMFADNDGFLEIYLDDLMLGKFLSNENFSDYMLSATIEILPKWLTSQYEHNLKFYFDGNHGSRLFLDNINVYGEKVGGVESNVPVPEPATILLLGSGLAGLAFYRRKRK